MGNVGQSGYACGGLYTKDLFQKETMDPDLTTWKHNEQIVLNCGIGSTINSLMYMGLAHNSTSTCKDIYTYPEIYNQSFQDTCVYQNNETNSLFEYEADPVAYHQSLEDSNLGTIDFSEEKKCIAAANKDEGFDFATTWFDCHCKGKS
jgi:hypothetical protein